MFPKYPYLDLSDRNLDFLTKAIREMENEVRNFVSLNAVKYANPIQWSINRQYEKNTIVIDPLTGTAFISVQPVPNGVALTRTQYWTVVFDLSQFVTKAASNFANSYERDITTTATMPTGAGDWVVWDSTLYMALTSIHAGDAYVINGNIKRMTVEDFYDLLMQTIHDLDEELDTEIRNRTEADGVLQENIDAEERAREEADITLQGNIDAEERAREEADTTLQDNIDAEERAREEADTALQGAIDDLAANLPECVQANIEDYGAVAGGVDDCRAAIIAAMATGKPVFIPAGVYRVSLPITVNGGVYITGAGLGKSILKFDEQTVEQRYVFENYNYDSWDKGAIFKNFTIDVNNYAQSPRRFHGGIFLGAFEDVLIDNVEVKNTSEGGNGITLWKCRRASITNCYCHELYGSGVYVSNKSSQVNVANNKIINSYVTSGVLDVYDSDNVIITGNYCEPNNSLTFGMNLDTIRQCVITNNNCNGGRTGISTFIASECIISNNTCRSSAFAGIQLEIGVDGVTNSAYNTVSNNFINYSAQFGIVDSSNSYYNKISDNQIANSQRHGIYAVNPSYIEISGNTIMNSGLEAANTFCDIQLNSSNGSGVYNAINNNVCCSPNLGASIMTQGSISGTTVLGNNCVAPAAVYNVYLLDTAGALVANNRGTSNV